MAVNTGSERAMKNDAPTEKEPSAQDVQQDDGDANETHVHTVSAVTASKVAPTLEVPVDDARDHALADAMKGLCFRYQRKSHRNLLRYDSAAKVTPFQIFHLLRRLCGFAAAVQYVLVSFMATYATMHVLRGMDNPDVGAGTYTSDLIAMYTGTGRIRDSPLVLNILGNDTTPRINTLYLESATDVSSTGCSMAELYNPALFSNAFVRFSMDALQRNTSYNLTILATSELIVPIVDCSQTSIVVGDSSSGRIGYLMRNSSSITSKHDVFLLMLTFSAQDYIMEERSEKGPALVVTVAAIHDVRQTDVTHHFALALGYPFMRTPRFQAYELLGLTSDTFWRLRSIPANRSMEAVKDVRTACRTGFYIDSEIDQSNVMNQYWRLDPNALATLTTWGWQGKPIIRDSWAWVHGIHFWFGVQTVTSLFVLIVVIGRNVSQGKIWIGNAFASISNSLLLRGALVLASWQINEFWTLKEFCLANASDITQNQFIYINADIMHADLLNVHLSFVSVLGYLFRERIDPTLVIVLFEIGFQYRQAIVQTVPALVTTLAAFETADLARGQVAVNDVLAAVSPMRLWTIHPLTGNAKTFILATMFPVLSTLGGVLVYIALRKVYRYVYPEVVYAQTMTESSANEKQMQQQKLSLTMFETATGAALRAKFGVISDYENYLFIKGTKYATSDGVYCNGYVIANGKFLVATNDLLSILAMKLTRVRFTNVYVYDVLANDVKQTARLVYPSTLSWYDLARVNINILK